MHDEQKTAGLLGFAQRSGNLVSGEQAVEGSIRRGRAKLVLLATDASKNTAKKFGNLAATHGIKVLQFQDMMTMGQWIGKARRSVVAVTDSGFAKSIERAAATASDNRGK